MNTWNVINWSIGIVGTLGVAGAIALAVFAPALAEVLFKGAVDIVAKLLQTRIGVAILVGLGCLILGELAGDYHGRSVADAACKAAQVRADAEALARDKQQGVLADQDAQKRIVALEASAKKSQEKLNAYSKALAKRKSPACVLGAGDLH